MAEFDVGIDFGTDNFVVYAKGKGIVLDEPSVIAFDERKNEVVAVGKEAFKMAGRTPPFMKIIRPMTHGSIADFKMAEVLLHEFLVRVFGSLILKPTVCICTPSTVTNLEKDAFTSSVLSSGARRVTLIEESLAAAIGCGIDFTKYKGNMIVDIGSESLDMAVISFGGIARSHSCDIGGRDLDLAIVEMVQQRHGILIGERSAEEAKKNIGSAFKPDESVKMALKGIKTATGLPDKTQINQKEIYDCILPCLEKIAENIHEILEETPPELAGDIIETGITLTGGTALLSGIADFISRKLGVPVNVVDDPTHRVAVGAGTCLNLSDSIIISDAEEIKFM